MKKMYEAKQFKSGKVFAGMPKETVSEALDSFFFLCSGNINFEQKILVEQYEDDGRVHSRSEDDWFWYFDPKKL